MNGFLLDTCTILWMFNSQADKISDRIRTLIDDPNTPVFVSDISLWEISIKTSLGKLKLNYNNLMNYLLSSGFVLLPIKREYFTTILTLPYIHRDPFDRLLIATSLYENLTFITADENIHKYPTKTLW
jgi:PIN domain nuclease of toxin-antitoxin system